MAAVTGSLLKCLSQVIAGSSQRGVYFTVRLNSLPIGANMGLSRSQSHLISNRFLSSDTKSFENHSGKSSLTNNETHGQPLHRFGSSTTLESAANRFDVDGQMASPTMHYQQDIPIDPEVDVYNHTTSVNLSACMQSQVPEPYGKSPGHMNMPGGISRREDKYVQGHLSSLTTKREYSTESTAESQKAAIPQAVDEHGNPTYMTVSQIMEFPCPQGVQGEDCEQFKLWLSNCLEHGTRAECEKLANEYIAGRMTLAQIFADYELQIKQAASSAQKVGTAPVESIRAESINLNSPSQNFTSTEPSSSGDFSNTGPQQPQSRRAKLKTAVRDYGSTVIVFHVAISLASLGIFYTLVASNVDVIAILQKVNIPIESSTVGTASTFAIAYGVHKLFAPVRIAMTLTCAPLLVRSLRARGILKTPKA